MFLSFKLCYITFPCHKGLFAWGKYSTVTGIMGYWCTGALGGLEHELAEIVRTSRENGQFHFHLRRRSVLNMRLKLFLVSALHPPTPPFGLGKA